MFNIKAIYGFRSQRRSAACIRRSIVMMAIPVILTIIFEFFRCSTPSIAADLPVKPSWLYQDAYNWTGLYGGVGFGFDQFEVETVEIFVPNRSFSQQQMRGFDGIVQGGYNWQIPNWWNNWTVVIGLELDTAYVAKRAEHGIIVNGETFDVFSNVPWISTARGRFGIPIGLFGEWLIYGTSGVGFARINSTATTSGPFVDSLNGSSGRAVWVVGGGLEYGISRYLSWKLEYTYLETGGVTNLTPSAAGGIQLNTGRVVDQSIRTGINFHL
jgi:outer membrane immunogenic protein